jgi:hypothetical protein
VDYQNRSASFIGGSSFLGDTLYGFKIDETCSAAPLEHRSSRSM